MLKIIKAIWFYLKVYRHTIRVILDYVCKPLRGHKTAIVYLLILFYGWQLVRHGIVIYNK